MEKKFQNIILNKTSKLNSFSKVILNCQDIWGQFYRENLIVSFSQVEVPSPVVVEIKNSKFSMEAAEVFSSIKNFNPERSQQFEVAANIKNLSSVDLLFVFDYPRSDEGVLLEKEALELFQKMVSAIELENIKVDHCCLCNNKEEEFNRVNFLNDVYAQGPKIIITLGIKPLNMILGKDERLSQVHGASFQLDLKKADGEDHFSSQIIPLFHPDYLLINPKMKKAVWDEIKKIISKVRPDTSL